MNTEQNKALVRRFFDEFNKHDRAAFGEVLSPDYVLDFPGGPGTTRGYPAFLQACAGFLGTFPDLHFRIENITAEGDYVAAFWTMQATQIGPLGPIPGTGRPVTLTGNSLIRVVDGKIVQDHVRADMLGVLQQIGAIPAPELVGL